MTEARLSKLERGLVDEPMETAHRIARALDTSAVFLYTCLSDDTFSQFVERLRHLGTEEAAAVLREELAWPLEKRMRSPEGEDE